MSLSVISIANEPILTFAIILLIIFLVPILFQKIKLPGIVGLLLAGTIVGPNGLGFIEAAGVIDVLGKVGLLYLMFLAGLEINLEQLKKERNNTIIFGALTFIIPQSAGTFIFYSLGYSLPASLLIASMFASHTLVAYPIITRLGLMKEKSVAAAVGGTLLTDTAALLVLAIVARSVEGELNVLFWVTLTGFFSLYLIFMFLVLPRVSYRFFQFIGEKGRYTYVYVISMMLFAAWLADVIGVEAIVGAFLAGLAFNPLLSNKGPLKNRVEFFGDAFFIPIFLIFVGMQVNIEVLTSSSDVWFVMGIMTLTVIVTKWLASFISAKILKFSTDQAWVIFGLTNSQAAATLAAVFVGMEVGLIGEEILNGAIMMILVTCIIGPMVVEKYGYKLADEVTLEAESKTVIKQRILVPLSNPATSARLIEFSANLRSNEKSSIYPLSVINTYREADKQRERAQKILEMASGHIHAINSDANPVIVTNLNIAEGIRIAAQKHAISDIVIGWNGEITTPMRIFGSIIDQVLLTTKQQVFICKFGQPVTTFSKIVIVVPPQKFTGRNFLSLLETLLKLAENLKTKIEIYHPEADESKIKRDLYIISPELEVKLQGMHNFDNDIVKLVRNLQESDLLVVANNRSGGYDWKHSSNFIPQMMSSQKPDSSFIVGFPQSLDSDDYLMDMYFSN